MALDVLDFAKHWEIPHFPDSNIQIRIGIHSGSFLIKIDSFDKLKKNFRLLKDILNVIFSFLIFDYLRNFKIKQNKQLEQVFDQCRCFIKI